MRYSAKSFSGEEEKTSCTASDESETLPGILRNSAITLFILDSSYSSKLVTLVSICLSPTHYFWCLQSPLFNIFRVFSLHSGFILKLNPFRCSWKCVSPQEFACYGRNAVKKKRQQACLNHLSLLQLEYIPLGCLWTLRLFEFRPNKAPLASARTHAEAIW